MLTRKEQGLLDRMEPLAAENGMEVITVEVIGSKKSPVIRVYIDAEGGVSFAQLTSAQEWLGALLDEIDPFPGAYTLEVSSPGIDRPLRTPAHFQRFVGEEAKVRTAEPVEGSSNHKGVIVAAGESEIELDVDGSVRSIPYKLVKRANLVGKIDF